MMKAGTIVPQSLRVETELYSQGWEIIKNSEAEAVDRDIRRADWNVLTKAEPSKLNCLEITEVSAKQFLGFPYVRVSAHSRHIQKSPFLQELAERAEP